MLPQCLKFLYCQCFFLLQLVCSPRALCKKKVLKLNQWVEHGKMVILLKNLLTLELLPQRVDGEHTDSVSFRGLCSAAMTEPRQ